MYGPGPGDVGPADISDLMSRWHIAEDVKLVAFYVYAPVAEVCLRPDVWRLMHIAAVDARTRAEQFLAPHLPPRPAFHYAIPVLRSYMGVDSDARPTWIQDALASLPLGAE